MNVQESGNRYSVSHWHITLTPDELKRLGKRGRVWLVMGDGTEFVVTVKKPRRTRRAAR